MEQQSNSFNDYVTCPYNKAHKLLRGRLAKHLEKCRRNSGTKELEICPFNKTHRYSEEELAAHIKVCPDSASALKTFEAFKPEEQSVPRPVLAECEENWDADPDVPAYNPRAYCEENTIIRTNGLKGQSKAARREFRANERRRFADKQ